MLAIWLRQESNASPAERAKLEGALSSALSRLMVVVEDYPQLKANQNFLALQEELTSTENKISFSRQFYNDIVLKLNNKIQMFPSNIIAGMTGFKTGEFFEVKAPEEREAVKVSFAPETKPTLKLMLNKIYVGTNQIQPNQFGNTGNRNGINSIAAGFLYRFGSWQLDCGFDYCFDYLGNHDPGGLFSG